MNTPRINRFLGEWLDRQTSPDFLKRFDSSECI